MGKSDKQIKETQRDVDRYTEDVENADSRRPSESPGSHDLTEHKKGLLSRLWAILTGYRRRNEGSR